MSILLCLLFAHTVNAALWGQDFNVSESNGSFGPQNGSDFVMLQDSAPTPTVSMSTGDVNNDGFTDILVGVRQHDPIAANGRGKVYLILGNADGFLNNTNISTAANATWIGADTDDNLGARVEFVGDVNNDGFDDFLMSATGDNGTGTDLGKVHLFFGATNFNLSQNQSPNSSNASYFGEIDSDILGNSLGGGGDINNDGFNDFLIGAPLNDGNGTTSGKAYLVFGGTTLNQSQDINISVAANISYLGNTTTNFSSAVKIIGDINNDSFDDFLIGAPDTDQGGTNTGKIFLIYGGSTLNISANVNPEVAANVSFVGPDSDRVGDGGIGQIPFAGLGDINGDGFSDLAIGTPDGDDGVGTPGRAYIFLGGPTFGPGVNASMPDTSNMSFLGASPSFRTGFAVAGGVDVNNDDLNDFLIGTPGDNIAGLGIANSGKVNLFLGSATLNLSQNISFGQENGTANSTFIGEVELDRLGQGVAAGGDINNDGFGDFLLLAAQPPAGGVVIDKVYVFLGFTPEVATVAAAGETFSGTSLGHNSDEREAAGLEAIKNQWETEEKSHKCYPLFKCEDWGECINGVQKRTCVDQYKCGNDLEVTRECGSSRVTVKEIQKAAPTAQKKSEFPWAILLFLLLLVPIAGYKHIVKFLERK